MKRWLIIGTSLIFIGIIIFSGVMMALKWDFSKLSTTEFETNNYEINENFKNISVITNTADIEFRISENSKSSVVCFEEKNAKHSAMVKNDTLEIKVHDTKKWYEHIGIEFVSTPKITIFLPEKQYGTLFINESTGDIEISKNFSFENIDISVSTGDINLNSIIAERSLNLETSTGDIKFISCDANEIFAKTSTGNITGDLLTDKIFIAQSDTGKIDVPKTTSGGKCELTTDTGDIIIKKSN